MRLLFDSFRFWIETCARARALAHTLNICEIVVQDDPDVKSISIAQQERKIKMAFGLLHSLSLYMLRNQKILPQPRSAIQCVRMFVCVCM